MFGWLKKLFTTEPAGISQDPPPAAGDRTIGDRTIGDRAIGDRAVQPPLAAMDVVDQFLRQNPQRTPLATLALIRAGATRLRSYDEVVEACEKIAAHGYQYPLSPTVQREVPTARLLEFLRWQQTMGVGKQDYENEHAVRALIQRFLASPGA
jgi:hypothetical protein